MAEFRSTGMSRPVDTLGRVVIPKEMRRRFGLVDGEGEVEFLLSDTVEGILLRAVRSGVGGCDLCGMGDEFVSVVTRTHARRICLDCARAVQSAI